MNTFQQALRPHRLTIAVVIYCCGIVAEKNHFLPFPLIILIAIFCITATLAFFQKGNIVTITTIFVTIFIAGSIAARFSSTPPQTPNHIYSLTKEEPHNAIITGTLTGMPFFDGTTSTVLVELCTLTSPVNKKTTHISGKILLRMHFPWPQNIHPGTQLAVRATIKRPARTLVPGTFDYPSFLAARNIWVTGYIRSPQLIIEIKQPHSFLQKLRYLPEKTRNNIGHFIDSTLGNHSNTGIYRALLIGDRSQIPKKVYENYRASGLAHLLCISGMHLSLIGLLLAGTFFLLLKQSEYLTLVLPIKKTALLLSLPFLVVYTFLAGLNPAAIRACLMAATVCLIFCSNRPRSGITMIAGAALLILLCSPQALFNASFQLSFAAILAIFLVSPFLEKLLRSRREKHEKLFTFYKILHWIIAALVVSLAATLGTAPLLISHFHRLPLLGPIVNLIVEPLLCLWTLPWGFLALLFLPIAPHCSATMLNIGNMTIDIANHIAAFCATIPHSSIWLPQPPILLIILYYGTFILALAPLHYPLLRSLLFILSCATLLIPNLSRHWHLPTTPTITFLDVGQGSATLIELPSGQNILIDAGASSYGTSSAGERIIAPFLWYKGITTLEAIIITHPDSDHYNGVPFLLKHFTPKTLWTSTLDSGEPGYQRLLALSQKQKIHLFLAQSGDTMHFGKTSISCLYNCITERTTGHNSNDGLVLLMEYQDITILFPGDIEEDAEAELVAKKVFSPVDLLAAAHHGSATSNSRPFLDATHPQAIIVSAGRNKKQRYPSPALTNYARTKYIPLYATHSEGSLFIEINKKTASIAQYNNGKDLPLRRNKTTPIPLQEIQGYGSQKQK